MKTKQTILKAFASLALAMGAFASADAQTNLGAACGCPQVNNTARPVQNISTWAPFGYTAIQGTYGGELTGSDANLVLTCDKTWILDKKIYIPNGKTLTINPGTVIKAAANTDAASATALIIERGGKINADGSASCPIVFTAQADPMNGTYAIENVGKWGGVVILGKATNNLTLGANGPFVPGGAGKLAVADGLGTVEGFATSNPQDQYGVALATSTNVPPNASGTVPNPNTYDFTQAVTAQTTGLAGAAPWTITVAATAGAFVLPGMSVTGTGFANNTTVLSCAAGVVTLSAQPTVTSGISSATFAGTFPSAAGTTGNFLTRSTAPPFTSGNGPFVQSGAVWINYTAPYETGGGVFNDDDNSGVMKYVSIRHAGAILAVGAEINGLTLASVGRGTTLDYIEIVSCADDNVEIFGGTVNIKHLTMMFGNDDMFDTDLGWTGKAQFVFGMKSVTTSSADSDNGVETDADDNKSNLLPRTHPVVYNMTLLGNAKTTLNSDNSALAAINAKDLAEGEYYNSIFANWKQGLNLIISSGSGAATTSSRNYVTGGDSWHNWSNIPGPASALTGNGSQSLKVKCNTFIGVTSPFTIANVTSGGPYEAVAAASLAQFASDKNVVVTAAEAATAVPGFSYAFTIDPATNAISAAQRNDVTPTTPLSVTGCPAYPTDGFFEPVNYRGAFSSVNKDNWLSNWSYAHVLNSTVGVRPCPTDLNADGVTNTADFLIFGPAFGTTCN